MDCLPFEYTFKGNCKNMEDINGDEQLGFTK